MMQPNAIRTSGLTDPKNWTLTVAGTAAGRVGTP